MAKKLQITHHHITGAFWIGAYLLVSLLPLYIVVFDTDKAGREFWLEFSVALGYVGLIMLCLQFALTARYKALAMPYGIDVVIGFHKYISLVAVALILIHPILLFLIDAEFLALLNIFEAPFRAQMGVMALVSLIVLVVMSLYREELKIEYEIWKTIHGILAVTAVVGALLHVIGVSHYIELGWKQIFWIAVVTITVGSLLYIRLVKPWLMVRKRYIVEEVKKERGDSWTLTFKPDGHTGLTFQPGQFAWLTLGHKPYLIEEHPFSFSSSAESPGSFSMTIKELGDFTSKMGDVQPGSHAYIDGPFGVFTPDRSSPDITGLVFIAGGVGITPVMSILRTMHDRKDERPVLLIYANQDWEGVTFREELEYLEQVINLKMVHVLNEAPDDWEGETGYVDADLLEKYLPEDKNTRAYFLCGPTPMTEAVEKALVDAGVPFSNIEMEVFNLV